LNLYIPVNWCLHSGSLFLLFKVIETGFAPAAYHALGWGPVQTSSVLGSTSVLLFFSMMFVFFLSGKKVGDEALVIAGSCFWIVGGSLLYCFWTAGAAIWHFVIPVMISVMGFPFIAASNRSLFTKFVDTKPSLETRHAFMQAVLSMAASVAGFVTPGFVAKYVLRHPDEVEASADHRELTPLALYIVIGPIITVLGVFYVAMFKEIKAYDVEAEAEEHHEADERTSLVAKRRSSAMVLEQKVDTATQVNRRMSAQLMGICQFDTPGEDERRSSVFAALAAELADDACVP
jgi:hypothetical protein